VGTAGKAGSPTSNDESAFNFGELIYLKGLSKSLIESMNQKALEWKNQPRNPYGDAPHSSDYPNEALKKVKKPDGG